MEQDSKRLAMEGSLQVPYADENKKKKIKHLPVLLSMQTKRMNAARGYLLVENPGGATVSDWVNSKIKCVRQCENITLCTSTKDRKHILSCTEN